MTVLLSTIPAGVVVVVGAGGGRAGALGERGSPSVSVLLRLYVMSSFVHYNFDMNLLIFFVCLFCIFKSLSSALRGLGSVNVAFPGHLHIK